MTTLADLRRGQAARVDGVQGSDTLSVRLLEMGLTPGCEVAYMGTAPLGDPLEFLVRGYRLSLRRREAARVQVTLVESPHESSV
jgi:ferrous iron transport protein A